MRVTSIIITAFLFLMTISIISNSVYFERRETGLSNRIVQPTVRYRFRCYFIQVKFNDCYNCSYDCRNNCYYNYIFNDVVNIFIGLILLIVFM